MSLADELAIPIEQLRTIFTYDSTTGQFCKNAPGLCKPAGVPIGYRCQGYIVLRVGNKQMKAHRVAWAMHYGEWPSSPVDHINRERADNRIANLRLASLSQNAINTVKSGITGKRGVVVRGEKYVAQIKNEGKYMYLGTFEDDDEAAHAYNKSAMQYHGEFAILNPIGIPKAQEKAQ